MGRLATHLAVTIAAAAREQGWQAQREYCPFSPALVRRMGFRPQCDLLLAEASGRRRLLVEFEISRADPTANQMKLAVCHLHEALSPDDALVSLCSRHLARGRRNLVDQATGVLHRLGIPAWSLTLLPQIPGDTIKRWNQDPSIDLNQVAIQPAEILEQTLSLADAVNDPTCGRIGWAASAEVVRANARHWQRSVLAGPSAWRSRRASYMIYDAPSGAIAPAKYCAYTCGRHPADQRPLDLQRYVTLAEGGHAEPLFDGHRAQRHLTGSLGMEVTPLSQHPRASEAWGVLKAQSLIHGEMASIMVIA